MQGSRTGATFQTPGMPGTTPYTEDGTLANAFPATTAIHFHPIVVLAVADIITRLLNTGHVIVVRSNAVIVVIIRTENAVRALCLRFNFSLKQILLRELE